MSESEMTDLLESTWKDVLQVAANEFFGADDHRTVLVSTGTLDQKNDFALTIHARRDAYDPMVSDRDTKDVGRQVLQGISSITDRLRVHNPGFEPDFVGNLG